MLHNVESVFTEIQTCNKSIVVGVIYRPPSQSIPEFLSFLENIFNRVHIEKKILYLMGDYNLDLLNVGKVQYVNMFLDLLLSFSMSPLISYPTRITNTSMSLIDNIITNSSSSNQISSGILINDVSDHFPVFCLCDLKCTFLNNKYVERRDVSDVNIAKFIDSLSTVDWCLSLNEPNSCYNSFLEQLLILYEHSFPLKRILIKEKRKDKPWITQEIRDLIKKKSRLYKLYLKNPTEYRKNAHKRIRNLVTNKIKLRKAEYYKDHSLIVQEVT